MISKTLPKFAFTTNSRPEEKPQSDSQRKGLLIILRDYSKKNNLEKIKQTVLNDIQKIWGEIIKVNLTFPNHPNALNSPKNIEK